MKWLSSAAVGGSAAPGAVSSGGLYIASAVGSDSSITATAVQASGSNVSTGAAASPVPDPAIQEAHEHWLAGVVKAAAGFGCSPDLIQQLPTESVTDALHLFALTAKPGSCLVLSPVSTDPGSMRYSFASGGKIDGIEIRYLSDVGRIRIWNGAEAPGN